MVGIFALLMLISKSLGILVIVGILALLRILTVVGLSPPFLLMAVSPDVMFNVTKVTMAVIATANINPVALFRNELIFK